MVPGTFPRSDYFRTQSRDICLYITNLERLPGPPMDIASYHPESDKGKHWQFCRVKSNYYIYSQSLCLIPLCSFLWNFSYTARRRQWQPTPVLLPGQSHGRRSLVGCSLWGLEVPDTTERLHFHFSLSCTGEGNGNPLHCSCLESPRDWGAW